MDPLSLAASIAGIISFAATAFDLTTDYFRKVKGAKQSLRDLEGELSRLQFALERVKSLLSTGDLENLVFRDTSVLVVCTRGCEARLEALCSKFKKTQESLLKRLASPTLEAEMETTLNHVKSSMHWIHMSLTVDGCKLLSKTSKQVSDVMQLQLQQMEQMALLQKQAHDLEQTVKTEMRAAEQHRDGVWRKTASQELTHYNYEEKHKQAVDTRIKNTGQWLIEHKAFTSWLDGQEGDQSSRALLCQGPPGSGKTILVSQVIDYVCDKYVNHGAGVAFVYFDYRMQESQSPRHVLSAILAQLTLQGSEQLDAALKEAVRKSQAGLASLNVEVLESILHVAVISSKLVLIVDAFDECEQNRSKKIFTDIFSRFTRSENARLFITCRHFPSVMREALLSDVRIIVEANEQDLRQYIEARVQSEWLDSYIDDDTLAEISDRLIANAEGSFLLPSLQLDRLMEEPTVGHFLNGLETMPTDLPKLFENTITRIQNADRRGLGMRSLCWILHSMRPLKITELQAALAIGEHKDPPNLNFRPSPQKILEICRGLVKTDPRSDKVSFVHYTVLEYLNDERDKLFPAAKDELIDKCMTYLLYDDFELGALDSETEIELRLERFPFLSYCAEFWGRHFLESSQNPSLTTRAKKLLNSQPRVAIICQTSRYVRGYIPKYWKPGEANSHNAFTLASYLGFEVLVEQFLKDGEYSINSRTLMGTTPVILAASAGHSMLVRLLLNRNADPHLSNWYGNALHCAAEAGQTECVKVLLEAGMRPEILSPLGQSAAFNTLQNDHDRVLELFLDCGVDANIVDSNGESLLVAAAIESAYRCLRVLLAHKSTVLEDGLTYRAINLDPVIQQMLLNAGMNVSNHSDSRPQLVAIAEKRGRKDILRLLKRDFKSTWST